MTLTGSTGADVLTVDTAVPSATLDGADGNDTLRIGSAAGTVRGGAGAGAEAGADRIFAGVASTFLYGGTGADRFIFASAAASTSAAQDQIEDFETGVDIIDLSAFAPTNVRVQSSSWGNHVYATDAGKQQFTLFVRQAVALSDVRTSPSTLNGTAGADTLTGGADDDTIYGREGGDRLDGGGGDDVLVPGGGNNVVDGGAGADVLVLSGARAGYSKLVSGGATWLVGAEGAHRVSGVERVRFADAELGWDEALAGVGVFDGLRYIASYRDLIQAFGADAAAGVAHFAAAGFDEGRSAALFDLLAYLASFSDLRQAFGTDEAAATRHYIVAGAAEGRVASFDAWGYLASYAEDRKSVV